MNKDEAIFIATLASDVLKDPKLRLRFTEQFGPYGIMKIGNGIAALEAQWGFTVPE